MRKVLLALLGLVILLVVGSGGWMGYRLFMTGFSAKPDPHPLEVLLARRIRRLAVPSKVRHMPNPLPMTADLLKESRAHFADHCAICHSNDGSGQTPIGRNVHPKAPDLRLNATQSMSDGELFFAIHNGIRFTAMPAWGDKDMENDTESWKLVHFIRHLPMLTQGELDDMKRSNPKASHEREHELEKETSSGRSTEGVDQPAHKSGGHHH